MIGGQIVASSRKEASSEKGEKKKRQVFFVVVAVKEGKRCLKLWGPKQGTLENLK